jgi:putative ATPase
MATMPWRSRVTQGRPCAHDKSGEEHYNLISAYIKSLRDSDLMAHCIGWMLEAGEPKFIETAGDFASEDVGNADPLGIVVATAVAQAVDFVGLPGSPNQLGAGNDLLGDGPRTIASYTAL